MTPAPTLDTQAGANWFPNVLDGLLTSLARVLQIVTNCYPAVPHSV
jgi:hypothetical protein